MSSPIRHLAYALGIALLATACSSPPRSMAGESGFTEAFVDAATLTNVMSDPSCVKVRFYNARRASTDTYGTIIAIGVKADNSEIYSTASSKYRMYDRLSGSSTSIAPLTLAEAQTRIGYVRTAGEKYYATQWTKSAIYSYLTAAGCNGVRLRPKLSGTNWSMEMHPVKLASGAATVNPAPLSSLCTEPCPTYCGTISSYYIHLP